MVVRYRVDGVIHQHKSATRYLATQILARVKILAGLNIAE